MTKLVVALDDVLLSRVLVDSQKREISLDTFISEALNAALTNPSPEPVRKAVNVDDLIASVVDHVRNKEIGSKFMLVDLFPDDEWEALSGGERKSLGKEFRKAVEGMDPPIAKYLRRTSSNKAVYKRV